MAVKLNPTVRILFLADTHLGYDLPFRPRIKRRRRGPEFFAIIDNFRQKFGSFLSVWQVPQYIDFL